MPSSAATAFAEPSGSDFNSRRASAWAARQASIACGSAAIRASDTTAGSQVIVWSGRAFSSSLLFFTIRSPLGKASRGQGARNAPAG